MSHPISSSGLLQKTGLEPPNTIKLLHLLICSQFPSACTCTCTYTSISTYTNFLFLITNPIQSNPSFYSPIHSPSFIISLYLLRSCPASCRHSSASKEKKRKKITFTKHFLPLDGTTLVKAVLTRPNYRNHFQAARVW